MKTLILRAALLATLLTGATQAQAFNLDIQGGTGGVPSSGFGAFSGQTGNWAPIGVNVSSPLPMTDITGAQPGATYTYDAAIPMTVQTLPPLAYGSAPPADVRALYDDYTPGIPNNQIRFQGLQPGRYRFFVYSWFPNAANNVYFQVGNSAAGFPQTMTHGFPFPSPPDFVNGQTWVARTLTVEAGEDVIITALCRGFLLPGGSVVDDTGGQTGVRSGGSGSGSGSGNGDVPPGSCSFAGFQIVPVNGTQGCAQSRANSLGGFPRINALGTIDPQGDFDASQPITLSAGSLPGALPPNRLILTFVSNNLGVGAGQTQPSCTPPVLDTGITPCLTPGPIYRAETPTILTNAFGVYTTTITPAMLSTLALQGLDTSPGATLNFQMIYQDMPVAGDACMADPVLRWTRTVSITLQ